MTPPLGSNSIHTVPTNPPQLTPKHRLRCTPNSLPRPNLPPLRAPLPSYPLPSIKPPPHRTAPPFLPHQNIGRLIPLHPHTPQTRPIHTTLPIPLLPLPLPRPTPHTTLLPDTQQTQLLPLSVPLPPHLTRRPPTLILPLHTHPKMHIQHLPPLTPIHPHLPLQRRPSHMHTHLLITFPHLLPHRHMVSMIPGLVQPMPPKDQHNLSAVIHKSRTPGT